MNLTELQHNTKFQVILVDKPYTDKELHKMTNGLTTWFVNAEITDMEVFENFDWKFIPVSYEQRHLHLWVWEDRSFWLVKLIPSFWNDQYIQYPVRPRRSISCSPYYNGKTDEMLTLLPPTYDLKYDHVWHFDTSTTDGEVVEAVRISYVPDAEGVKIVHNNVKNQFNLVTNTALPNSLYTDIPEATLHYSQGNYCHVWNLTGDINLPNYDVWAYKLEPKNFIGSVFQGTITAMPEEFYKDMVWEVNPLFDNIKFEHFEFNYQPLADSMKLTHTWYLDSSYTPPGERIWAIRLTPSVDCHGDIDMGSVKLNLVPKIIINPDFQLYNWSVVTDSFVPSYDSLQFLHVWYCEGTDKRYGVKISFIDNPPEYKEHGYIRPYMFDWSMGPGDTKLYWHFDKFCSPGVKWNKKYMPARGNEDKVHVFMMTNPKSGRVTDWAGCYLIPLGTELTPKLRKTAVKVWDHGCIEEEFDIVFLSNNEPYADENYKKLDKLIYNKNKLHRINGVKGLLEAHKAAANVVSSNMFFLVDADCVVDGRFTFDNYPKLHDRDAVYVWHVKNVVNGLSYGFGGVKLFPTELLRNATKWNIDLATSIGAKFIVIPRTIGTTEFNSDPETAWRSGFREAAKLSSKLIKNQVDEETDKRLEVWCSVNLGVENGEWTVSGAQAGRDWIRQNTNDINLINDFDWLHEQWIKYSAKK